MVENKYEIRTDLPSARARRFESGERDLSPALLPLVILSWRNGRGRTRNLTPHLLRTSFFGSCGRRPLRLGFWCIPKCWPFVILLVQDVLLFPLLEFKEHVLLSNAEANFSSSYIDPCPGGPQDGCPRMSSIPRWPSISIITKSARMKESRTRTKTFLTIPSGYRIVESVSSTHIYVGETAGYRSFSYITMGMMLTLAPRSQSACS